MDSLFAWASSQPVWLQVFVGLALFAVALPAMLALLYWAARAILSLSAAMQPLIDELVALFTWLGRSIVLLLFGAIVIGITWHVVELGMTRGWSAVLDLLPFSSLTIARDGKVIAVLVGLLLFACAPFLVYLLSRRVRAKVREWRQAIGAD